LQVRVSVSSKGSASIKSGIFSGGNFPSFSFFKIGSCLLFKKFCVKSSQVSKIGFKVFSQSFGRQQFYFAKSVFMAYVSFQQSQVSKISYIFSAKVFGKFGSGFFARFTYYIVK